jgi:hypothetical protein
MSEVDVVLHEHARDDDNSSSTAPDAAKSSAGASVSVPASHADRPDCYYFMSNLCKKADACEFRHAPMARYATVLCKFWAAGACKKPTCEFLHTAHAAHAGHTSASSNASGFASPHDQRSVTPCYWLTQPSGCSKGSACPYLHPRTASKRLARGHDDDDDNNADTRTANNSSSSVTWRAGVPSVLSSGAVLGAAPAKRVADLDSKSNSQAQSILSRVSLSANSNAPVTFSRKAPANNNNNNNNTKSDGVVGGGDLRALIKRAKQVDEPATQANFVKKFVDTPAAAATPAATTPAADSSALSDIEALKAKNKRKFGVEPASATSVKPTAAETVAAAVVAPPPTTAAAATTSGEAAAGKKAKVQVDSALEDLDAELAALDELLA